MSGFFTQLVPADATWTFYAAGPRTHAGTASLINVARFGGATPGVAVPGPDFTLPGGLVQLCSALTA